MVPPHDVPLAKKLMVDSAARCRQVCGNSASKRTSSGIWTADRDAPERIAQTRPDYVLVLPWNLKDEISQQLEYVRDWGGRLVFPIPALEIV